MDILQIYSYDQDINHIESIERREQEVNSEAVQEVVQSENESPTSASDQQTDESI